MEFKASSPTNNNRVSQPQPPQAGEGNAINMMSRDNGSKTTIIAVVLAVAIIIVGGIGWWFFSNTTSSDGIKKNQYQAVFLTNGQVYFCKLGSVTTQYVDCSDIYYLQVQQSVQPTDKNATNKDPQVSLAKLGSELHGPEDQMHINRDQVLFWENLKDSGKVVQAIKQNQQQK